MRTFFSTATTPLLSIWAFLLLIGIWFGGDAGGTVVGYLWFEEFSLAGFLFITLVFLSLGKTPRLDLKVRFAEFIWIILPTCFFTVWSGLSFIWASSWRNVAHHTLLWACYTIFYLLVRWLVEEKRNLDISLNATRYVVFIISSVSIIEFLLSSKQTQAVFFIHYSRYSEISITLLPLLFVAVIDISVIRAIRWIIIGLTVWCSVVIAALRTTFIAGVGSVLVFSGLSILLQKPSSNLRRWIIFIGLSAVLTFGSQNLLNANTERVLFQRLAANDTGNVQSAALRLFYWGMAFEGFKKSPIVGIGSGNYFSEYKILRERYTTTHGEDRLVDVNEDLVPERAHNEYLQILCELGVVGALLFGWLLAGIVYMFFLAIRNRTSFLAFGALAGLSAFLAASFATSYSFRLPVNGLGFFFLTAVAAREVFSLSSTEASDIAHKKLKSRHLLLFAGLFISLAMMGFSVVRALSLDHLSNFQNTQDRNYAVAEITKSIALDPSDPMFRFSYGQELFFSGRYDPARYEDAIFNFRLAIQNGLATTPVYFNLLAAEMCARKPDEAERTFSEALAVYPRSVFLLTAHSAFLRRVGNSADADLEYQRASAIDEKQARSWQLAHDEGLERLTQIAKNDARFVDPKSLVPAEGPVALLVFQQQPN